MNREKAIEAGARVYDPLAWKPKSTIRDEDYWERRREMARKRMAAVIDAALPHLVDSPRPHGEDCPRRYVGPRTLQIPPCRCDPGDWP